MPRVNVIEPDRTVSFVVDAETLPRIVAASSADPSTFDQLLVATEAYQRGFASQVMDALMDFDRATAGEDDDAVRSQIEAGRFDAFEAADAALAERVANGDGVMSIDLAAKTITLSPGLDVPRAGDVFVHDGRDATDKSVTYELPRSWTFHSGA